MLIVLLDDRFLIHGVHAHVFNSVAFYASCMESESAAVVMTSSTNWLSSMCGVIFSDDGGGSDGGLLVVIRTTFFFSAICPCHSLLRVLSLSL